MRRPSFHPLTTLSFPNLLLWISHMIKYVITGGELCIGNLSVFILGLQLNIMEAILVVCRSGKGLFVKKSEKDWKIWVHISEIFARVFKMTMLETWFYMNDTLCLYTRTHTHINYINFAISVIVLYIIILYKNVAYKKKQCKLYNDYQSYRVSK